MMRNRIYRKIKHILTAISLATCLSIAGCASQLTLSAESGDINQVKTLLDQGADPNSSQDRYYPPLMAAIRPNPSPAIVKLLLDRGANPDKAGYGGYRALHWAAKFGETEIVKILLEHGATPEVTTTEGHRYTPIKLAIENGHTTITRMLTDAVEARSQNLLGNSGSFPPKVPSLSTQTFPYQSLDTVPPGQASPIDGLWIINQGRLRIAAGRMFFANTVAGVARTNMVNIKDIKQTGTRTYALNGFVAYQGKGYYVPGEFQVISDRTLLLTLYPKPELGLPNGYSEVYTREKLDDDALFTSQLTAPTAVTSDKTGAVTTPNFKATPDHNAVAIVIGIEKYQLLPAAGFVRSDANLMREYLKAMGYQDRNIEFLIDDRATFSSIRKAVETWLPNRINAKSRVIVYYAGHGAPDPQSGDAYIVPYDGDPNYLPDTGYPLKRLYERLEKLPAKQVVVMIDACFSGAGGRGVLATGARSLVRVEKVAPKGNRIAVLTSTQGTQISTSSPEKQHGLFTYYLLKALQDNNRDLASVYDYLRSRVEDEAKRMNVEQTPAISPDSSAIRGVFNLW